MVQVNNFENMSRLKDMVDRIQQNFAHPYADLKLSEMQNLTSNPNTGKDILPGLQIIPDKGDIPPAKPQTLELRNSVFAPSQAMRIPFISELTAEFLKGVKEQCEKVVGVERSTSRDSAPVRAEKPRTQVPDIETTIKPSVSNGFKEVTTIKGTDVVVSTVDVYINPQDRSITRTTRLADGKLFSQEVLRKDKSREVTTFDEKESQISRQTYSPEGAYEMHNAKDEPVSTDRKTVVGAPLKRPRN